MHSETQILHWDCFHYFLQFVLSLHPSWLMRVPMRMVAFLLQNNKDASYSEPKQLSTFHYSSISSWSSQMIMELTSILYSFWKEKRTKKNKWNKNLNFLNWHQPDFSRTKNKVKLSLVEFITFKKVLEIKKL